MTDIEIGKKQAARDILSMIEDLYFSDEYKDFRIDYGSNGVRDLIINSIKIMYGV